MKGEEWLDEPRVQEILLELEQRIRALYPAAEFEVTHGGEPDGVYLTATIDTTNVFELLDAITDRLLEIQIDEKLPIYVIPIRPERPAQAVAPAAYVTG